MTNGPPAAPPPFLPDARVTRSLTVSDFDYELPPELIAQTPAAERSGSRLLHLDDASQLHDRRFADLTGLLRSGDLLVFNDTRVIKARLNGHKTTGGKVEVLVERITEPDRALAHVRASKSPGPGMGLRLADAFDAVVLGREGELFDIRFSGPVLDLLDAHGATPLPPYHARGRRRRRRPLPDRVRARTRRRRGATAGLHFDQATLDQLDALGVERAFVTLHVARAPSSRCGSTSWKTTSCTPNGSPCRRPYRGRHRRRRARRPRDRRRHHQRARPGIGRRADRRIKRAGHAAGRRPGRHTPVHHAGLPVPRG